MEIAEHYKFWKLIAEDFFKMGDMTFIKYDSELAATDRERRNTIVWNYYLWPGAVIPYYISPVFFGKPLLKCPLNSSDQINAVGSMPCA